MSNKTRPAITIDGSQFLLLFHSQFKTIPILPISSKTQATLVAVVAVFTFSHRRNQNKRTHHHTAMPQPPTSQQCIIQNLPRLSSQHVPSIFIFAATIIAFSLHLHGHSYSTFNPRFLLSYRFLNRLSPRASSLDITISNSSLTMNMTVNLRITRFPPFFFHIFEYQVFA